MRLSSSYIWAAYACHPQKQFETSQRAREEKEDALLVKLVEQGPVPSLSCACYTLNARVLFPFAFPQSFTYLFICFLLLLCMCVCVCTCVCVCVCVCACVCLYVDNKLRHQIEAERVRPLVLLRRASLPAYLLVHVCYALSVCLWLLAVHVS